HAASASGNQTQALQLSQVSPEQLKQSDDLLFARAIALQRANKTQEAIDELNTFLQTFPKSPLTPGVKIRLALALADNHRAGDAIATLRDLIATASPKKQQSASGEDENADQDDSASDQDATSADKKSASDDEAESDDEDKSTAGENSTSDETNSASESSATGFGPTEQSPLVSRLYMSDSNGYPEGESQWNAADSAVYGNISGADTEQIYQFIDTLLNFAPLPELLAAPDNKHLSKTGKRKVRAILAERYLAA